MFAFSNKDKIRVFQIPGTVLPTSPLALKENVGGRISEGAGRERKQLTNQLQLAHLYGDSSHFAFSQCHQQSQVRLTT